LLYSWEEWAEAWAVEAPEGMSESDESIESTMEKRLSVKDRSWESRSPGLRSTSKVSILVVESSKCSSSRLLSNSRLNSVLPGQGRRLQMRDVADCQLDDFLQRRNQLIKGVLLGICDRSSWSWVANSRRSVSPACHVLLKRQTLV